MLLKIQCHQSNKKTHEIISESVLCFMPDASFLTFDRSFPGGGGLFGRTFSAVVPGNFFLATQKLWDTANYLGRVFIDFTLITFAQTLLKSSKCKHNYQRVAVRSKALVCSAYVRPNGSECQKGKGIQIIQPETWPRPRLKRLLRFWDAHGVVPGLSVGRRFSDQ